MRSHKRRGQSANTAPGTKPEIATRLEQDAEANLRFKLSLLTDVVEKKRSRADVEGSYGPLPTSSRQFNLWQGGTPGLQPIRSNNNDTLRRERNRDILSSLEDVLKALALVPVAAVPTSREVRIASLRRSLAEETCMRKICERDVNRLQEGLRLAEKKVVELQAQLASVVAESRLAIDRARSETAAVRKNHLKLASSANGSRRHVRPV